MRRKKTTILQLLIANNIDAVFQHESDTGAEIKFDLRNSRSMNGEFILKDEAGNEVRIRMNFKEFAELIEMAQLYIDGLNKECLA